jgi:ubiquinone/menaquinone biosynthesis C-methylase UbiE
MIDELLPLICDPLTKEELIIKGELLVGSSSSYPLIDGIPILLKNEEDQQREAEKIRKRKSKIGFSWALSHWTDLDINGLLGKAGNNETLLLNFGSGSPLEKEKMAQNGYKVVSIDINAGYTGVDIIADGHALPFKDNVFDVVTAFEVLEHLHEPWTAIKEINRVLKPGGKFVGSVAFLKEFHSSYFHMTYWGVAKLLDYGGLEVEVIYGGQDIFGRLVSSILPIGPSKFTKSVYSLFSNMVMFARKSFWSMKSGIKYNKPIKRFDDRFDFSFEEYEKIMFAPTVLFRAKKVK